MASRARSRQTTSLTNEQLQALGCVGKDITPVSTAPPPTFPPLINKPVNSEITAAQNYQILWKEDFLNYMRDYYLTPTPKKTADQRYSDQYNKLLENTRAKCKSEISWELLPAELKPSGKRKNIDKNDRVKKKMMNNDKVLNQLNTVEDAETDDDNNADNKGKQLSDSEKEENDEIENEEDDEMDDDNDYGNNYFDNGEAFNEEDDNLDDGPVY